jgi:hypothetical protein
MTQLTANEAMLCGYAIGICNLTCLLESKPFWANATKEEMIELIQKLEKIQTEGS